MKIFLTILFTAFALVSCDETKKVIDVAGNVQLSGAYKVSSLDNTAVSENAPTFNFFALDKTIKGSTGCNSFFGNYTLDLYAITFSDIASTERACDQPIMDIENSFMNALRNAGSYDIENSVLTIYSKADRSVLMVAIKDRVAEN